MKEPSPAVRFQVATVPFVGFSAGLLLLVILILTGQPGFVPILDGANLLFHEAGHPAAGLFSERLAVYGGTLGQLAFPVVLIVYFGFHGQAIPMAVGAAWFFENFFNIARYVADARAQELPLVGGGEHDWFNILHRWHALPYDTAIAQGIRLTAWVGLLLTWTLVGAKCLHDRCVPESLPADPPSSSLSE